MATIKKTVYITVEQEFFLEKNPTSLTKVIKEALDKIIADAKTRESLSEKTRGSLANFAIFFERISPIF